MADELLTYENALELYNNEEYTTALTTCLKMMKESDTKFEVFLLAVKAYVHVFNPLKDEDKKTLYQLAGYAAAKARTVEEVYDIENQAKELLQDRYLEVYKAAIELLEKEITMNSWGVIFPLPPKLMEINLMISITVGTKKKELCEAEGLSMDEASKKYSKSYSPEEGSEHDLKTLLFAAGNRIFDYIRAYFEQNNDGNTEYMQAVSSRSLEMLAVVQLVFKYCIPDEEANRDDLVLVRTKALATAAEYELNAILRPNGTPMSLIVNTDGRVKKIEELKGYYDTIRKIDPSFEEPPLPDEEGIQLPTQSGGCYVATSVYGSYDCPQVWTLRRFRDDTLGATWYGRLFIRTYYAISPTLVKWFGEKNWFKKLWKPKLDKMVAKLNDTGVENTPYNDRQW